MNNGIKYVATFILGAGSGVLFSNLYLKKKYQMIADEEIDSVKSKYYIEKMNWDRDVANAKLAENRKDEEEETPEFDEEEVEEYVVRSSLYSSQPDKEEEDIAVNLANELYEKREAALTEMASVIHPSEDGPYEISEEEFSETELEYDKVTLHYFVEDDVIYNPGEAAVEMGQTIGDEGVNIVRTETDRSTLYFRNETYGVDYEVIKIAGSYFDN